MDLFRGTDFALRESHLQVLIPIFIGLISYLVYWFYQESHGLRIRAAAKYGDEQASKRIILSAKYLGAVSLGLIPFLTYIVAFPETTLASLGLALNKDMRLLTWILGLGIGGVLSVFIALNAGKSSIQKKQPEIRVAAWSWTLVLNNLLAWTVYLLGYEFFFRGVLFFPLMEAIGIWPAVAVNALFYAGVHLPKGLDETLLAIPLAVGLCMLTAISGTIWIAFLVHLCMAWTVTLAALKKNPEMSVARKKN